MTKIIKSLPPNYGDIVKALPAVKFRPNGVFTYAPHIYFPRGGPLEVDLVKHEEVHIRQQAEAGGAAAWWERYLKDPRFRMEQELEAYQVQFKAMEFYNRGQRRVRLNKIASDLSSAMYGKIITKAEALEAIQHGGNDIGKD